MGHLYYNKTLHRKFSSLSNKGFFPFALQCLSRNSLFCPRSPSEQKPCYRLQTVRRALGWRPPSRDQPPSPQPLPARFLLSDSSGTSWFSSFLTRAIFNALLPLSENLIHVTLPYSSCTHFKMLLIIMFPVTQLLVMLYFKWISSPQMNQKLRILTYKPSGIGYQFSGRNNGGEISQKKTGYRTLSFLLSNKLFREAALHI